MQDGEGRAQYAKYANNDSTDTASTAKGNQLTLSSKLQNTVGNLHKHTSYESFSNNTSNSVMTCTDTTEDAYYGNKSLKITSTAAGYGSGTDGRLTIPAGATYTFSAYVKVVSGKACLAFSNDTEIFKGEAIGPGDWTRLEYSYTNTSSAEQIIVPGVTFTQPGTAYVDCCQVEEAPTASRYNLVEDGDFRFNANDWTTEDGYTVTTGTAAAPELENTVYTVTGDPESTKRAVQSVKVSGNAGDTFVVSGWAKGNAVPFNDDKEAPREFGIIATFHYTDGTAKDVTARFNPDVENWQ